MKVYLVVACSYENEEVVALYMDKRSAELHKERAEKLDAVEDALYAEWDNGDRSEPFESTQNPYSVKYLSSCPPIVHYRIDEHKLYQHFDEFLEANRL